MNIRGIALCFAFGMSLVLAEAQPSNSARCAGCHPQQAAAFDASPMGRSIGNPTEEPDGRVQVPGAHTRATIRHKGAKLVLQLDRDGIRGSWPMAWSVGAGLVGRTDIVRVHDYLFQSPVSWYAKSLGWDLSPGYESKRIIDVDRPIVSGCLFCHTGAIRLQPGTTNQFREDALTPITCERCHGSAAGHLDKPVKGNIVNPARLSGRARDSVCEQCHLEGEARILNPGRDWWDFQPGDVTESVFVTYVKSAKNQEHFHAVSHSEQLAESRCLRASGGKLWCGSCHSPHASASENLKRVTSVCLSCHQDLFSANRHQPAAECTSCHMPKLRADNVAHAAVTDHRIPRRPQKFDPAKTEERFSVRTWRAPAKDFDLRDKGLALVEVGQKQRDPAQIREGYDLLADDAKSRRVDSVELKAIAGVLLEFGEGKQAIRLLAEAEEIEPKSAAVAWSLGLAYEKSGDLSEAIREFKRAVSLDPSLPQPYLELAKIYAGLGDEILRRSTLTEYLRFMPQSIRFRVEEQQPSPGSERP